MGEESKGPKRDSTGRFASKPKDEASAEPSEAPIKEIVASADEAEAQGKNVVRGKGAMPENETPMQRVERLASGDLREGEWVEDISDTVAPSVGPHSVVFRTPGHEAKDNIDLDAMGNDKRRQVVGQSYGASFTKQATIYGIFLAIVVGLLIGGKILVDKADQPPKSNRDQAPWSASSAPQRPPAPIE